MEQTNKPKLIGYIGHSIATDGEAYDSKCMSDKMEEIGIQNYSAAKNEGINDKSLKFVKAEDIYHGDLPRLLGSQVVIYDLNGGTQDGTISEVGFTAGYLETLRMQGKPSPQIVLGYSSNSRVLYPDFEQGIASGCVCHLPLGMVKEHGVFVGTKENLYKALEMIVTEYENSPDPFTALVDRLTQRIRKELSFEPTKILGANGMEIIK